MGESDKIFVIGEREGYAPQVGVLVSMLQNARSFLLSAVRDLSTELLDAPPGPANNTIGSILAHLDAAENMFQLITFEKRRWNEEEDARYRPAFEFKDSLTPRGRDLESYLRCLRETRERTLAGMRSRTDDWLKEPRTFGGRPANAYYYWLHYLQDEARHTGQIILVRKYLVEDADPEFDPYFH